MKRTYIISVVLLMGGAISSVFSLTFHVGWLFRGLYMEDIYLLLIAGIIIPVALVMVASINEKTRLSVLAAAIGILIASLYFIYSEAPNPLMPSSLRLSRSAMFFLFLGIGMAVLLGSLSMVEASRLKQGTRYWMPCLFAGFSLAGLFTALNSAVGAFGWLYTSLLSVVIVASAGLIYIIIYPGRKGNAISEYTSQKHMAPVAIMDKLKGSKLAIFCILSFFNMGLVIGLSGLNLVDTAYSGVTWLLFASLVPGLLVGFLLGLGFSGPFSHEKRLASIKVQVSQYFLIVVLLIHVSLMFSFFTLELLKPGYHGTITSQIVGGIIFGFMLSTSHQVILQQHPPKANPLYHAFLHTWFFIIIVLGNYLKGIPMKEGQFESLSGDYLPYIMLVEVILAGLVLLLASVSYLKGVKKSAVITTESTLEARS
ncbi:hypothetical protein GF325_14865 [Candidatus Bathyarchaeota archaeon]|nr:hypothetical protein [Candidatus Bathyarchaeota archaeon]